MKIYAIRDSVISQHQNPILALNDKEMFRRIKTSMTKDESLVTNAKDLDLYDIGEYETETGKITGKEKVHIINLQELKAQAIKEFNEQQAQIGNINVHGGKVKK